MRRHTLVLLAVFSLLYSAKDAVGNKGPADDRERERNQRIRYTSSWAVEIAEGGSKAADAVAKRHGYRNLGKVANFDNIYHFVLANGERAPLDAPYTAKSSALLSEKSVGFADQQIIRPVYKRSYTVPLDPRFPQQWHLLNTGQFGNQYENRDLKVEKAWIQGLTGCNVTVAVVDDGFEYIHPDLITNYAPNISYDFVDGDPDPIGGIYDWHGTRCAGVIAAAKDGEACGVGVAYNSKFGGIRLLGAFTDINEASSLSYANDVIDIYSNSWGPCDEGCVNGPLRLTELALKTGAERGRGGKGSIFVWANGNGGPEDDCAADGYATSIYTISVGAIGVTGEQSYYDEDCSSKMTTAYVTDDEGYSAVSTTATQELCVYGFGGTSASCPMVAGAIALTLEANPDLTWRDVMYLIVFTSNPSLTSGGSYTTNRAGIRFSPKFGFGVLDAEAMVARARHWVNVPPQLEHRRVPSSSSGRATWARPKVIYYTYQGSITYLEHVIVNVTLQASGQDPQRGDFRVEIRSPLRTQSTLLKYRVYDTRNDQYYRWPFMTLAFWGENPSGRWQVTIKSQSSRTNIDYSDFAFQFYGTSETPLSVSRIPNRCHSNCSRGCAAAGAMFCDACVRLRNAYTLECINECPLGYTKRNGYCYNSSQPEPVCKSKLLSLTSGSCTHAGYRGCCVEGRCEGTHPDSIFGFCYCDNICHSVGDCCEDIASINCTGKEVGNQMQYITLRSTTGVNTYAVPRTDDGSSLVVRIPSGLPIGSSLHTTVYVGTNGYLSFDNVFTDYRAFDFPGDGHVTLVAPFFTDIDISKGMGSITYEVHTPTNSEALFSDIHTVINDQMKTNFTGSWLIVAEWKDAPEFGGFKNITNTFQAIVITDFTTSYALFIYKCQDLQFSGSATIGFTAGDVLYSNHRLSGYKAKKIACINSEQTEWVNLVYKLTREDLSPIVPIDLIDECALDLHNCEQVCIDLASSYVCSCYDGYALLRGGSFCFPYCTEHFTSEVGDFNTPSWPDYYPESFRCEWTIDPSQTLQNLSYILVFTVDRSAYGISCDQEYIEFFDGLSFNASSLGRFCGQNPPMTIHTTGMQARVVFQASDEHPDHLKGVRVTYTIALLVNECEENSDNCEQKCIDTPYSFTCDCESGYTLTSDGYSCEDVNECYENSHTCKQICINRVGSYNCSCNEGFVLASDMRSCVPSCGGNFSALSGSFQSPGWPEYYPEVDFRCEWVIDLDEEEDHIIHLVIDDSAYGIFSGDNCRTDYLAFYDGLTTDAPSLGKFCYVRTPSDRLTSSDRALVVFQASSRSHSPSLKGARVSYMGVRLVNECLSENGGCDHMCEDTTLSFNCHCRNGFSLNTNGQSCDDIDECSTDDYYCGQKCVNTKGSYVCDCWEGFALNSDGKTCRVSCGGTYTARNGSFHTPGWPVYYPIYFRCEWLIHPTSVTRNMVIELTVDQEYFGIYGRTSCNTDYLEFHDGNTTDARSLGKYCQFNTPTPLYTSSSQALVIFQSGVFSHLPSHVGVKIFYQLFESVNECEDDNGGCEGTCVNTLKSYECHCGDGYILASDGFSCEDIDECSTEADSCEQQCINTKGSYLCDCREGFALNSDGRTCRVYCSGTYTARNGSFHTPGWPVYYPLDFRCEWLIHPTSVTRNTIIVLTVDQEYFGIHGSSPCNTDYLEFHDGNTTDARSLGKYCQFNAPRPLYTSSSRVLVVFQASTSPHSPSRVGVKISYHLFELVNECEDDNGGCEGTCINTVTSFECRCGDGYVLASDGFRCEDVNECLNTPCDHMCTNTEGSFYCTCREDFRLATDGRSCVPVCGGEITTDTGSISTPGWPQFYPSLNFTCEWTFQTSNNTFIDFSFDEQFGIQGSHPCPTDYVEIFDGLRDSRLLLGKFCSLQVPAVVSTSSNTASIVFQASRQSHSADHVGVNITFTAVQKVNECEVENGGCEQVCVDLPRLYSCSCESGYTLSTNGKNCDDINECVSHNCEFSCVNTLGSFHCACNDDFVVASDGRSCVPSCGGRLTQLTDTFNTPGWPIFYHSLNYRCEWIIDVENHTDAGLDIVFNEPYGIHGQSPCDSDYVEVLDGVGEGALSFGRHCFISTPDTVLASTNKATVIFQASTERHTRSRVGVSITYRTVLFNVNECEVDNGGCDQVCVDAVRSYTCSCEDGYTLDQDGRGCTDIDECSSPSHGCAHTCVNTQGSYSCECRDGYMLHSNGRWCTISCGGRFTGPTGSFSSPGWPEGYPQLDFRCVWTVENVPDDRSVAFVVNDMAYGIEGNSPCHADYIEFFDTADTSGESVGKYCGVAAPEPVIITSTSARAVFQGRVNQNRHSTSVGVNVTYYVLVNECSSNNGGCEHSCSDTIASYECGCRSGYQLTQDGHTCEDIDECILGTHECSQRCVNAIGFYSCKCREQFSLAPNGKLCIPECGEQFSVPNGTFYTPGWPDFYPELDFECEWIINVDSVHIDGDTRMGVQFNFNQSAYGFGSRSNCDRDYMQFYKGNGSDAKVVLKVCSDSAPLPFTISSTQVKVIFKSSSRQHVNGQVGASVTFYTIEQEFGPSPCNHTDVLDFNGGCRPVTCGGTLYAMTGQLQSPNWPTPSSDNHHCQWAIVLPDPQSRVKIVVDEIDITNDSRGTCFWNYLMFFDSTVGMGFPPLITERRMCGTDPPSDPLLATGNVVNVWYYVRRSTNRGFSLSFFAV